MRPGSFLLAFALGACGRGEAARHGDALQRGSTAAVPEPPRASATVDAALRMLRNEETALRARTDFETLAPSSRSLGANPYALAVVPGATGLVGILRGDSRVVLLDERLAETSSLPTPPSPSALAVTEGGHVFVASPLAPKIARYHVENGRLEASGAVPLPPGSVPSAVVADERSLVVADFVGDRLLALPLRAALTVPADVTRTERTAVCQGPLRLAESEHFLAVDCLFDHAVLVLARDALGMPSRTVARIVHDGPIWSVALLEHGGELVVGLGGAEDHALERRDRVFGYIDSFVYVYALRPDGTLERRAAENVSERGVVMPKAVELVERDGAPVLVALGYGSDTAFELTLGGGAALGHALPGCNDLVVTGSRRFCANPLFDAWVELPRERGGEPVVARVRPATASEPSSNERLGEALFFTTLMAPEAKSEGRLSRFTCETCHFEGGTDGRVHNSGRDEIRVTTRSLLGLFNDAPHFSRAHDRDLTSVCHNEFAVANRGNPVDPWFSLDPARFRWLGELGVGSERITPLDLRRALLAFLARFSPEENPFVASRKSPRAFDALERAGAEAFRTRCAGCHAPRLVANDPKTLVPFERWESLVLSDGGPIVWARGDYEETGIFPYVDPQGTRIPSLRRLYTKRPYFTNGSGRTLEAVLDRVRYTPTRFFHAAPVPTEPNLEKPGAPETEALLAFLRLL